MKTRLTKTGAAALVTFVLSGTPILAQPADPPKKPDPKQVASDRGLAERMMPTAEELKAKGWKLPWDLPAGIKMPLMDGDRDNFPTLYRQSQDRYWESRAYAANSLGCGLSPADVVKRIDDMTKVLKELKARDGENPDAIVTMKCLYAPPGWWQPDIESSVRVTFMTEQQTRFTLCRTSKWDDVNKIGEAAQAVWDIVRKHNKGLGEVPGGQLATLSAETFTDSDWMPANKRLAEALGGCDNELLFMKKHEIGWTTAVVNVRKLNPDGISGDPKDRRIKDLSEEDAKRLEEKLNAAAKAQRDVATPIIEKQLEDERAFIKKLKDQGFPTKSNEEALAFKQQAWKDRPAPTYKLQRLADIGAADCYVLSTSSFETIVNTDILSRDAIKVYWHAASLRNGVYLAEVEIMSTMSEEESKKDLKFLLTVLQRQTTRGGVTGLIVPKSSSGGSVP